MDILEKLSPEQIETLQQFRENVRDLNLPEDNDYYMVKWLIARRFDLNKAVQMIRKSMQWRKDVGADDILETFQIPEVIKKYFAGSICGEDNRGGPVVVDAFGRMDLRGIASCVKRSDILRYSIWRAELLQKALRQASEKHGRRITQCTHILDFEGFGTRHMWKPGMDLQIEILTILQDNYPEVIRTTFIINAPRIFGLGFKVMKPFLAEDLVKKFIFLGGNWKDEVGNAVKIDTIPVLYGGTLTDPDGDPSCSSVINYGGIVPKEYYRSKEELLPKDSKVETISRGKTLCLKHNVEQGQLLSWIFHCSAQIKFGIYRKTSEENEEFWDMETIREVQTVDCRQIPEEDSLYCKETGTYIIVFDNRESWFSSKTVTYHVALLGN